jgi:hypothetical protein
MNVRCSGRVAGLALLLACSANAADPGADKETAKQRAYDGVSAYEAGNYDAAARDLEAAFATLQAPSVGLWSARALEKTGKWALAAARYRQVSALPAGAGENKSIQDKARADAAGELRQLVQRLPAVRVAIENATPSDVIVTLDGKVIRQTELSQDVVLDPGDHTLAGTRGAERVVAQVRATPGRHEVATLTFAPPPAEPSSANRSTSPLRTAGLVGMGVGGAGLVLSGVSALVALGKQPSGCDDGRCRKSQANEVDGYSSWRTVSTISFWTGAAIASAGAVVYFTAPRSGAEIAVHVAPSYASVSGRF